MIHSQTVRDDQLDRMAKLGITPSFFVSHTFFWGDWHRDETLGLERAMRISPTRSATERGIRYTLHNDPPVVPPDMIRTLWSATTRRTRSHQILGAAQRASIAEALAAITIDAAHQYGEDDRKGSIAAGKQADFVIVDQDPLAMDPENLLQLKVLETISRGKTVYTAH
jgi:predicted amidohydrolase YtcJ